MSDTNSELQPKSTSFLQEMSQEEKEKKRKIKWHLSDLGMLALIVFSFVYLYLYFREKTEDNLFTIIFFGVIVATGITSGFVAHFSVGRIFPVLKKLPKFLKGNFEYSLIRSLYAEPSSLLDHLVSSLKWCLFPTLTVFFFLSYIAELFPGGKALVAEGFNLFYIFLFLLPAVGMILAAPLRVLTDSSLIRYSVQERTIEPFGKVLYRLMRAIGGMGALAAFLKVALKKSGVIVAIQDTFMILMFVLPTMFIATIIYSFWHVSYVRKLDQIWENLGYREYRLEEKVRELGKEEKMLEIQPVEKEEYAEIGMEERKEQPLWEEEIGESRFALQESEIPSSTPREEEIDEEEVESILKAPKIRLSKENSSTEEEMEIEEILSKKE
ncbi:MAG TPA: hypothetical protein EYP29_02640 [Thermoplasmata archaeon]|nr:hypothetical protein [Thermoplasmata archaeon]